MFKNLYYIILRALKADKVEKVKDGYIEDSAFDLENGRVFGASKSKKVVLRPAGQWLDFLPKDELQRNPWVETMNCTVFAMENCLEMIAKCKFGEEWNKSERYTGVLCGTTKRGNSMTRVLDLTRKYFGVIDDYMLPFKDSIKSWEEYYSGVTPLLKEKGKLWLTEYEIEHDRIIPIGDYKAHMKESLKYSPLYVGGYAWAKGKDGKYYSWGQANHAFTVVGYVEGQYWLAYDSYSPFIKKLDWNFRFGSIKQIYLNRTKELTLLDRYISNGTKFVLRAESHGELYKVTPDGLVKSEPEDILEVMGDSVNKELPAKDRKELVNQILKTFFVKKIALPINEDIYNKLTK